MSFSRLQPLQKGLRVYLLISLNSYQLLVFRVVEMPRHTYVFPILAYFCPNWNIVPHAVRTNKPSNTWCRAPGML